MTVRYTKAQAAIVAKIGCPHCEAWSKQPCKDNDGNVTNMHSAREKALQEKQSRRAYTYKNPTLGLGDSDYGR